MLTPLTLTAQATLLWLADSDRTPCEQPPEEVLPRIKHARVHAELLNAGLIRTSGRFGNPHVFDLNSAGHDRAEQLAPAYRRKRMEYRLLRAVQTGQITRSADLPTSDTDNPAYTETELRRAARKLRDGQFIHRGGTNPSDLLRTEPTPLGESALEHDYAPDDYLQRSVRGTVTQNFDHSINITGSPGVAAATGYGNAVSHSNTISMNSIDQFDAIMSQIREHPILNAESAEVASDSEDSIRDELVRGSGRIAENTVNQFISNLITTYGHQVMALAGQLPGILG